MSFIFEVNLLFESFHLFYLGQTKQNVIELTILNTSSCCCVLFTYLLVKFIQFSQIFKLIFFKDTCDVLYTPLVKLNL